ncbi:hypothetical protein GUITHDRAFT_77909 [Guillardia theta CCMP2712]|uniref:Uncharacterized protein n=1 Tax=Guillardia theta (strain CCMP2712) TaxID=905079 RepID=L1IN09_GUITC|nr:hypothetical protein GUITHDRAFT_77909 [Guillardia theta CCMP2712]EKX37648.1 hypothetical protein GUITHDRAFT_77909 [Guillardia theta CCMP2712]|eukprot:XP_005824628.1 hypothetical protein GUITHDRAFT_77909 [Guillardia theta CCMP2712]
MVSSGSKDVPAWQDEDDKNVSVDIKSKDRLKKLRKSEEEEAIDGEEYAQRLRSQVLKVNNNVSWATRAANVKSADGEEDGMNLLKSTAKLTGSQNRLLPSAVLDVERMKDANISDVPDCVIQTVRFHTNSQLMMTAGLDKRLRLYQVDGKKNPKVQSVYFEDLPITSAEFSADGDEVFVSGRRKHFYVYNLAAAQIEKVEGVLGHHDRVLGQFCVSPDNKLISILSTCGGVQILSRKTKQKIGDLKMNCDVNCCAYSPDGCYLYTAGDSPIVYQWDMRTRRCVRKIEDEGSLKISSLAVTGDGGLLACGSQNGVVNTYDVRGFHGHDPDAYGVIHPATRKSVMNLTTSISQLRFSPDGQALAMASHVKKEGLKILHVSSNSVFSNWPTSSTPLHYVSSVDFSANNRFLAIGNDRGKVLLYRLKHYL